MRACVCVCVCARGKETNWVAGTMKFLRLFVLAAAEALVTAAELPVSSIAIADVLTANNERKVAFPWCADRDDNCVWL